MSSSDFPNPQGSPPPHEHAPHTDVLAEHAESIRKLGKRLIGDVMEIGRRLRECKQLLGHGNWLAWIEREFRWSERTARNFIAVYDFAQSKSANFADLAIDVSSVYLLARPSTPEEVRAEMLRRVEAGETLPHTEVKRVVGAAREREAAAGTAKRRISIREVIKRRHGDFWKLPAIEQQRVLDKGPMNVDLAIADATTRQSWKPAYRELQDALDALETMAKRSTPKIIVAIPVDDITATLARVERAKELLTKFGAKLAQVKNVSSSCAADDAASLADLLKKARKTSIKKYGRPNQAKILETIWPDLNAAQIAMLQDGQYGPAIKATAGRLAREITREMAATPSGMASPGSERGRGKK